MERLGGLVARGNCRAAAPNDTGAYHTIPMNHTMLELRLHLPEFVGLVGDSIGDQGNTWKLLVG